MSRPRFDPPVTLRVAGYAAGLVVLVALGAHIGSATYDCPPGATDCDLGGFNAAAGAVVALAVWIVAVPVVEIVIAARRGRR